jgi:hypothetical protein
MSGKSMAVAAAVALLSCPLVTQGTILTFVMEGTVSTVGSDPPGLPSPVGAVGDRAVYTFTFDSDAPNTSWVPWAGGYQAISSSLRIGSQELISSAPTILIQHPGDLFDLNFSVEPPAPEILSANGYFSLNDQAESNALVDVSLPLLPYDLGLFAFKSFTINLLGPPPPGQSSQSIVYLSGAIDEFYAVPEPGCVLLLVLALAAAFKRRPRRVCSSL